MSGTHVSNSGGSLSPPSSQLAYVEGFGNFTLPDASDPTPIPTMSIALTVPVGTKYIIEFYASAIDEDSGVAAGEIIVVTISIDSTSDLQKGSVVQAVGGVGGALFMRTATLNGDGLPHTYEVVVANITNGPHGVIVESNPASPLYLRALAV